MVDMASQAPEPRKVEGQSFWDANPCGGGWSRYVDFLAWVQRTEPYAYEIVDRYDWADNCVLDVGCGQGTLLNYLPYLGAEVFGLDMSLKSLRRAASGADELGYSNCVFLSTADAECLPFPDAYFDAVLSFGVLHHTPDTYGGVKELHRVLKSGGLAIVMLYRSGNPKWWMTYLLRRLSRLVDLWEREGRVVASSLRAQDRMDDERGTALLELFGVPILKAFSNRQVGEMFSVFSQVQISNHQPGFVRMADIMPVLKPLEQFLRWFDQRVKNVWGFYQVVEARK